MRRVFRRATLLAIVLFAAACDPSGPRVGPPTALVRVMGDDQTGAAGVALGTPITVRVNDAQGQAVAGVVVTFAVQAGGGSVSPAQAQTNAEGQAQTTWTLGVEAGSEQRLQASFPRDGGGTATIQFRATASAGTPVNLVKAEGDNQHGGTGAPLQDSLAVRVTDQFGNGVAGISVTWTAGAGSVSPTTRTTNSQGFARTQWTLGTTEGTMQVQASAGSLATVSFSANAQPLPLMTGITPAQLLPGGAAVITGVNFPPDPAAVAVSVAGVAASVTSATATEIRITLAAGGYPCLPTGPVTVQLTAAGTTTNRAHPARVVTPRPLAVGEALVGSSADPLECVDLPEGGSRYLIAVTNTDATVNTNASAGLPGPTSTLGFRLSTITAQAPQAGTAAAAAPQQAWVAPSSLPPLSAAQGRALAEHVQRRAARHRHHEQILRANEAIVEELRRNPDVDFARRPSAAALAAQAAIPAVGDVLPMRVPDIEGGAAQACNSFFDVQARVTYVGERAIVLEDTENPVQGGPLDHYFRQLGEEFDQRQYNVIRDNFGDPLLLDANLNNDGRVFMLFSRRVDGSRIAGFVFSGDFAPRSNCPQSNEAEIFYGYAPQTASTEWETGSAQQWWWEIRAVVIHEVKHIASFAQRIFRQAAAEESWLEEAGAMAAEEIWARQVFGYGPTTNTGYAASIGCEIRGAFNIGACAGRPGVMFSHFVQLSTWLRTPDLRSPLGMTVANDGSFYGSGWLLLRHLLDHSGRAEQDVLSELTQSTSRGAANVTARVGRPFADVLGDFTLAAVLDNRTGVPAAERRHFPSWNVRDVYAGLFEEQPQLGIGEWPGSEIPLGFSAGTQNVSEVRGGGTTYFLLSGSPAPLALRFQGSGGTALPAALRVQVFRIQ